jgi:flagellar hook assembly protein FlgD
MTYQDLLKDTSTVAPDDNNKFIVTVLDLDVSSIYPTQFRWKYSDGTFGKWSAVKNLQTIAEAIPGTPSSLTAVGGAGFITVTWDGKDSSGNTLTNFKQLDIYINGSPFNASKPADTFFAAGTKTIAAPAGVYLLTSYAVSTIGTQSLLSTSVTATVTSSVVQVDPSETPSTPTVSSVLGAIQLAWNGKTSSNTDQPSGFKAAKVYVGTTAGFTPIDTGTTGANQVDVLNFGNGQNTLNIGLGTLVNGVALDHGIDYYVKIKTTNGNVAQDSTAVAATGNPVRVGQVQNGSLVTITADKISTGTLSSGSTITVGSTSGKHVKLSGTGDPLTIYGTGGISNPVLTFNGTKLSIVGDGSFTGDISGATGTLSNALNVGTPTGGIYPFSVSSSGFINANSGKIGGWDLGETYLQNTAGTFQIDSTNSRISLGPTNGLHIRLSTAGITTYNGNSVSDGFNLTTGGSLSLSGTFSTSQSLTAKRIVMNSGSNRILFKTASTDLDINNQTFDDGYLQMDTTSVGFLGIPGLGTFAPGLRLQPPSRSSYEFPASITMVNHPNGGGTEINGLSTVIYGWLQANGGTSSSLAAVRNISAFAGAPAGTDGRRGDVWFQI